MVSGGRATEHKKPHSSKGTIEATITLYLSTLIARQEMTPRTTQKQGHYTMPTHLMGAPKKQLATHATHATH